MLKTSGGGGSSSSSPSPIRRSPAASHGEAAEAKGYVASLKCWLLDHGPLKTVRRRNSLSKTYVRRLDSSLVRDAFHDRRTQLLTGDPHNLDVLGPYAQLHLRILEARNLLPLDCSGSSDPYVEVFVNDVQKGRSAHVHRTVDPSWDFEIVLDIWSPFTIVRIAVMDWDRFSKDDFIGFVEFRVAEVEPNGPFVSGWCELRLEEMLEGTATHRFRRHRNLRDDHEINRLGIDICNEMSCAGTLDSPSPRTEDSARLSIHSNISLGSLNTTETTDAKLGPSIENRRFRYRRSKSTLSARERVKAAICCGGVKEEDSRCRGQNQSDKRLNAGKINICMRLKTVAKTVGDEADAEEEEEARVAEEGPCPSLGRILLCALLCPSWLLDICQVEEWYACCFPHPTFEAAEADKDSFSLQDVKGFYEDATQLKATLLNCVGWPLVSIFLYIVCWRDIALSGLTMGYWLLFCMWPFHLLPTIPLWCAFWLRLLRDRGRSNAFFVHEATAPLTEEGLAMIAALHSSQRMGVWLRRLVKDRGGWVDKMAALASFARLTHKDGRPTLSFDHLVEDLMARPWVRNKVSRGKRCREGHVLQFLGMGMYRPDDGWCCCGLVAQRVGSGDSPCEAGVLETGLHLGVRRYYCPSCCINLCGLCAAGGRALPQVMKVNPAKLPMGGSAMVRAMRDFVLENQDAVDDVQELLEGFLKVVERLLNPLDADLAFNVYVGLGALSAALLFAVLLAQGELGYLLYWSCTLFWMAVGSALMVQGAMPIRRLRTAYRASRDYKKCRDLRQKGGCARWAFFTPDVDGSELSSPHSCCLRTKESSVEE